MPPAAPSFVTPPTTPAGPAWKEFVRAPLVPVALAASAGLVVDRYSHTVFTMELAVGFLAVVTWAATRRRKPGVAPLWLWLAAAAAAAAHHNAHRGLFAADDIGKIARGAPTPVRVRGTLDEEPARFRPPKPDPLLATQKVETTVTVLALAAIQTVDGWRPAGGRARLTVEGRVDDLHHGDEVEVVGRLSAPGTPSNPGETDYRSHLLDQQITAELRTKRNADGITRLEEGWRTSVFGWLAAVRGWGTRAIQVALPDDGAGLAAALLLGDGTALDRDEWDSFVRTGVVHVLAISGQHLVVLAGFVWGVLQLAGTRRRYGAWAVAAILIGYALLTGGRPSAMRAAVMVTVVCGGIILRRHPQAANAFALAWLVVVGLNPTDPFTAGCQLSFLSVFALVWGVGPWLAPRPPTPLEELVAESRSLAEKMVRRVIRAIAAAYAISLVLGVVNAPLILAWQNLVSPIGIVLGPPLVLLTSIALIAGFILLLVSPLGPVPAVLFALVVRWCLAGCEKLVHLVEGLPGGFIYAPGPALWWLAGFHTGIAAVVLLHGRARRRCLLGLAVWTLVGLASSFNRPSRDEMRVTFLAVGHGGCVVFEAPDGRVLLYDTGTTTGPDVVRRVVAPYLWSRGITRVDEVFLSHADLDHFNGLPELLKRFAVGQVTLTPSFSEKPSPGVAATLGALDRHGVARRVARAGDRYAAGDVGIEVLHPPASGPDGNENTRSLVLLVRHAGHTILLTGDLEGVGQEMVVERPISPVDVLLAPHHGAVAANARRTREGGYTPGPVAAWARPQLVVSCQGPRPTDHLAAAYAPGGGTVWDTATVGAVTVRSHSTGLVAETFRTREVRVVHRGTR